MYEALCNNKSKKCINFILVFFIKIRLNLLYGQKSEYKSKMLIKIILSLTIIEYTNAFYLSKVSGEI